MVLACFDGGCRRKRPPTPPKRPPPPLWLVVTVLVAATLCVGVLPCADAQTETYVDCTNGSDSNSGSVTAPLRSIDKAISVGACASAGFAYSSTQSAALTSPWVDVRTIRVVENLGVRIRFYTTPTSLVAEVWNGSAWTNGASIASPTVGGTQLKIVALDVFVNDDTQTFYAFCVAMNGTPGASLCYGGLLTWPTSPTGSLSLATYYPFPSVGTVSNLYTDVALSQGVAVFTYTTDSVNFLLGAAVYGTSQWTAVSVPTNSLSTTYGDLNIAGGVNFWVFFASGSLFRWDSNGAGGIQPTQFAYQTDCTKVLFNSISLGNPTVGNTEFAVLCNYPYYIAIYDVFSATRINTITNIGDVTDFGNTAVALSTDQRYVAIATNTDQSTSMSVSIFDATSGGEVFTSGPYWTTTQLYFAFAGNGLYTTTWGVNPFMYAFLNGVGQPTTIYLVAPSTTTTTTCVAGTTADVTITCPDTVFDIVGGVSGASIVVKGPTVWTVAQTTWQNSRYTSGVNAVWSAGSGATTTPSIQVGNYTTAANIAMSGWSVVGGVVFKDVDAANGSTITSSAIDTLVVVPSATLEGTPESFILTNLLLSGGGGVGADMASIIDVGNANLQIKLVGDPTLPPAPTLTASQFLLAANGALAIKGGVAASVVIDATTNTPIGASAAVQMKGTLQLSGVGVVKLQGQRLEFSQKLLASNVTTTYLDADDIVFSSSHDAVFENTFREGLGIGDTPISDGDNVSTLVSLWQMDGVTLRGLTTNVGTSHVSFVYGNATQTKLVALEVNDADFDTPQLVTLPLARFQIYANRQTAPYTQSLPTVDWTYFVYLNATSTSNLNLQLATSPAGVYLPHWGYQQRIEEFMYHAPRAPIGTTTQGLVIYDALPGGAATLHIPPDAFNATLARDRMFELLATQLAAPYASRNVYIRDTANAVTYGCSNTTTGLPFYQNAVPDCDMTRCQRYDEVAVGCPPPLATPLVYMQPHTTGTINTTTLTLAVALGETLGGDTHGTCASPSATDFQMGQVCQFQQGAGEAWLVTFGAIAPSLDDLNQLFGDAAPPTPVQLRDTLGNCSLVWSPMANNEETVWNTDYPQSVSEYWTPTSPMSGLPWSDALLTPLAPALWSDTLRYTPNVTMAIYAYAAANNDPTWMPDVTPNGIATPFGVFASFANKTVDLLQSCRRGGQQAFELRSTPTETRLVSTMFVQNIRPRNPLLQVTSPPEGFSKNNLLTASDITTFGVPLDVVIVAKTSRMVVWWRGGYATTTTSQPFAQPLTVSDQLTLMATFLEGDNTTQWTAGFTDTATGVALPGERYTPQLVDASTPPATSLAMTNFSSPLCYAGADVPSDVVVFLAAHNVTYAGVCFFNTTLRLQAHNAYVGDQNRFSGVMITRDVTVWSSPPWATEGGGRSPSALTQVWADTLNHTYAFERYSSGIRPVALVANNTQVEVVSPQFQNYMTVQQNASLVYPTYMFDQPDGFYLAGALAFTDLSLPLAPSFAYTSFANGTQTCTTNVTSLTPELRSYALQWDASGLCVFTTTMTWTVWNIYVDETWLFDGVVTFQQMALVTTTQLDAPTADVVVPPQPLPSLLLQDDVAISGQGRRNYTAYFTTPQVVSTSGATDVVIRVDAALVYPYYTFDNTTTLGLLNAIQFVNDSSNPPLNMTWTAFPTGANACSPMVPPALSVFFAQQVDASGLCVFNTTVQWQGRNQYAGGVNVLRGNLTLQRLVLVSSPTWPPPSGSIRVVDPPSAQTTLIDSLDVTFAGTLIRSYATSRTALEIVSMRAAPIMTAEEQWNYAFPVYPFDDAALFTLTGVGGFTDGGTSPPLRSFHATPFSAPPCTMANVTLYPQWESEGAVGVCIVSMTMTWSSNNAPVGQTNIYKGVAQITGLRLQTPSVALVPSLPDVIQTLDVSFPGSAIPAFVRPVILDSSPPTVSPDTDTRTPDMEISVVYTITLTWPLTTIVDVSSQRWFVRGEPRYVSLTANGILMHTTPWTSALVADQPCTSVVPTVFQNQTDTEGTPYVGVCAMRSNVILSMNVPAAVAKTLDGVSWQGTLALDNVYMEQASPANGDPPLTIITTLITAQPPYSVAVNVSLPLTNGLLPLVTPITSHPSVVNATNNVSHQFSLASWVLGVEEGKEVIAMAYFPTGLSPPETRNTRPRSTSSSKTSPSPSSPLAFGNAANVVGIVVCGRPLGAPPPSNFTYFTPGSASNGGCFDTRATYNLTVVYDPSGMLLADYGGVSSGWNVTVAPSIPSRESFHVAYASRSLNGTSNNVTTVAVVEEQIVTFVTLVQSITLPTLTYRRRAAASVVADSGVIAPIYVTSSTSYVVIVPLANTTGNGTNPGGGGGGGGGDLPTWVIIVIVCVCVVVVSVGVILVLVFTVCRRRRRSAGGGIVVNLPEVQHAVQKARGEDDGSDDDDDDTSGEDEDKVSLRVLKPPQQSRPPRPLGGLHLRRSNPNDGLTINRYMHAVAERGPRKNGV